MVSIAERDVAKEIIVDCAQPTHTIRPLHGVNGGPSNAGETIDLTNYWKELAIPITRLHDCDWPNPAVVDMHVVFPSPTADPEAAASYQFSRTDDYLAAIEKSGAAVVYRLGESIEHSRKKYYVHPPADFARWADACLGIIRHENEGWADGAHRHIRYWEIWNEPENRPAMWSGSDDDYDRLYVTAAKRIKEKFPDLLVGGPAVGAAGEIVEGKWRSTPFLDGFLEHCTQEHAPLDFFSWHTYTDEPQAYGIKARGIRAWLDEHGFTKTEIHLNEWNLLPKKDWGPLSPGGQGPAREKSFAEIGGISGAAFLEYVLLDLQTSPVDVANYYAGDTGAWGLFTRHGVPTKTFYAFLAFRKLLETPDGVATHGHVTGEIAHCAGFNADKTQLNLLLSKYRGGENDFDFTFKSIPWTGGSIAEFYLLDAQHNLDKIQTVRLGETASKLRCTLATPGILLVRLSPAHPAGS
ncbi:MAG TPA: hypothetical protein VFE24_12590 [Pirellulales bacterium]|nr:hypothetical protein [Pirellulales bacterium]